MNSQTTTPTQLTSPTTIELATQLTNIGLRVTAAGLSDLIARACPSRKSHPAFKSLHLELDLSYAAVAPARRASFEMCGFKESVDDRNGVIAFVPQMSRNKVQ